MSLGVAETPVSHSDPTRMEHASGPSPQAVGGPIAMNDHDRIALTGAAQPNAYAAFLARKTQLDSDGGFAPVWLPGFLFDFQSALVDWSLRKGRAAIFAGAGPRGQLGLFGGQGG